MNSWTSTGLSAWAPPLSTFSIGIGRAQPLVPPRYRYRGRPSSSAAALAAASEVPRMALAPSRALLSVASRATRRRSRPRWSSASQPSRWSRISRLTLATAPSTPLPMYRPPPSRRSTASWAPVDAPDGTMARPRAPVSSRTSTSTVGLPRESRTSLPTSCWIALSARSPRSPTGPAAPVGGQSLLLVLLLWAKLAERRQWMRARPSGGGPRAGGMGSFAAGRGVRSAS